MDQKLPIRRLSRLTILQTLIIGFIFYLVISNSSNPSHKVPFTLLTMSGILMVGFNDILLMTLLSKRFSIRSRKFVSLRRSLTYPASILIYLLLRPCFGYIGGERWPFWDLGSFMAFFGSGIVINILIGLMHDSVLLYEHKLHSDLELSRLKAANAEAMNMVLKQQIQPHFLFNALNTLKALYHKDTQVADEYIVHMASFLRASIFHQSSNISPLKDELQLLYDYLEMQRIRFGDALMCTINVPEETMKNFFLPSFSLQPLLENAIKHNNFTREQPLNVIINQAGEWLVISNNLQKRMVRAVSANYGLANLAERYRLWSGDEIIIKEDAEAFSVSIKLLKNEHSNY